MLEIIVKALTAGALAAFAGFLLFGLFNYAVRRFAKQGLMFGLIACGFLHAMATKSGSDPEPPPPTTAAEDWIGDIVVPTNAVGIPEGKITVDSGTEATITVAGLPAGLTFDKKTNTLVYDAKRMKDGNYAFVVSAKNKFSYKTDRVVAFASESHDATKDPDEWNGGTYFVGRDYRIELDYASCSAKDSMTLSGLPAGLKLVKDTDGAGWPAYRLEGVPTKVGRFMVTWTETHYYEDDNGRLVKDVDASFAVKYYMTVEGRPSQYVEAVAEGLPTGCKVTGSGVYAAGTKITLKATAAKGLVFAGWYSDAERMQPVNVTDVDYRNPTLALSELPDAKTAYYPRYVELKDDFCGEITVPEANAYGVPEGKIAVDSVSLPTITVAGLPRGLTFDKKTNALVFDERNMRDGDYAFVVSAKNAGGYRNDRVVTFQYGDPGETPGCWTSDYEVGQIVDGEDLGFGGGTAKDTLKVSGLPAGLKVVVEYEVDSDGAKWPSYSLSGVPTKAGRYAVTWTETHYYEDERGRLVRDVDSSFTEKYWLVVQGAPSRYVEVVADGPTGCKVTGSGVVAAGATLKTSATAARDWVFAGWSAEGDEEGEVVTNAYDNVHADFLGKDGDFRLASQAWLCGTRDGAPTVPAYPESKLIGRFVPKAADTLAADAISVIATDDGSPIFGNDLSADEETPGVYGGWNVRMDGRAALMDPTRSVAVSVDSASAPKLTIKGAPAGITVKNYGSWAELYYDPTGKAQPKPGEYVLTLTAVNQSKVTVTRTVAVRIPNQLALLEDGTDLLPNLDTSVEGHFAMTVGETILDSARTFIDESLEVDGVLVYGDISVSGLPSGVTCKKGVLSGVPTKAGCFTMTVTVKYTLAGETKARTATATAFFRVEAIDPTCVGTFNGAVYDADTNAVGTVSLTVSAVGKVTSCKLVDLKGKATSLTFKSQEFFAEEGFYAVEAKDKDGRVYAFELDPALSLSGSAFADLPDGRMCEAWQNVWADKTYKLAGLLPVFPSKGIAVDYKADGLSMVFKPSGAVTVKRGTKSASARFELATFADGVWTGAMTVNVPDGTAEGYCKMFDVGTDGTDIDIREREE